MAEPVGAERSLVPLASSAAKPCTLNPNPQPLSPNYKSFTENRERHPSETCSVFGVENIKHQNTKTPNTKHQTPNTKHHQTPNTGLQISNTKPQAPNLKPQTPNTKHQRPNTNPQSLNTKHQTPNTKHQTSNTKHQIRSGLGRLGQGAFEEIPRERWTVNAPCCMVACSAKGECSFFTLSLFLSSPVNFKS